MRPIKRMTTETLMRILYKRAKEDGRIDERKAFIFEGAEVCIEYALSSNYNRKDPVISNYEWDLSCVPGFGGNEGFYLDISMSGYFLDGQTEREEEHIATVKSLDTDRKTAEAFGALAGNLVFRCRELCDGMIGRLTPMDEIRKDIERAKQRGKQRYFLPFLQDEQNLLSNERGFVVCFADNLEKAREWKAWSPYRDSKVDLINEEAFKSVTYLPWLDYAVV